MRHALSNRPLAVLVVIFTLTSGWLLHKNPFGSGTIALPVSLLVALIANLAFTYGLAVWAAPFLASTGGSRGAAEADPETVAVVERWTAGTLLLFGTLGLFAVGLASSEVTITPTQRLERNAQLVRETVNAHAPQSVRYNLNAADTWKMSSRTYRSCVPVGTDLTRGWCVLTQVDSEGVLRVVRWGPGKSNAAQALEWHPELKKEQKR